MRSTIWVLDLFGKTEWLTESSTVVESDEIGGVQLQENRNSIVLLTVRSDPRKKMAVIGGSSFSLDGLELLFSRSNS